MSGIASNFSSSISHPLRTALHIWIPEPKHQILSGIEGSMSVYHIRVCLRGQRAVFPGMIHGLWEFLQDSGNGGCCVMDVQGPREAHG